MTRGDALRATNSSWLLISCGLGADRLTRSTLQPRAKALVSRPSVCHLSFQGGPTSSWSWSITGWPQSMLGDIDIAWFRWRRLIFFDVPKDEGIRLEHPPRCFLRHRKAA